jgi:predicted small integral membrane protein
MTARGHNSSRRLRAIYHGGILIAAVLLILLLTAIAMSKLPMRGAEIFGALAKKVKGNPRATAVVSLGAGAALWMTIAVMAAVQEWLSARRGRP